MSSLLDGRPPVCPVNALARNQPAQPPAGVLTLGEVCALLRVSKSTVERLIRSNPDFPQPIRLSGRLVRFLAAEVHIYLSALPRIEYDDHAFDPNDRSEGA